MGKIDVMDSSGHIGIEWGEGHIDFDLQPKDNDKANEPERKRVLALVEKAIEEGFECKVDGEVAKEPEITDKTKSVRVGLDSEKVKSLLTDLLTLPPLSTNILVKLNPNGDGEVIDKRTFKIDPADKAEYQSTKPLAGG